MLLEPGGHVRHRRTCRYLSRVDMSSGTPDVALAGAYAAAVKPSARGTKHALIGIGVLSFVLSKVTVFGGAAPALAIATPTSLASVVPIRVMETRIGPNYQTIDGVPREPGRLHVGSVTKLRVNGRGIVPEDADCAVAALSALGAPADDSVELFAELGETRIPIIGQ